MLKEYVYFKANTLSLQKMKEKKKINNIITRLLARARENFNNKNLKAFSSAALLLSTITIAQKQAQAIVLTYQLGQEDNFNQQDGPEESTYITPDEMTWFRGMVDRIYNAKDKCNASIGWQQRCQLRLFDENIYNRNFLHSFDLSQDLQNREITSATFESKIKIKGSNDKISFGHVKESGKMYQEYALSLFNAKLYETIDINVDLNNITTSGGSSLLSEMNKEKTLLFHIQDDTMVDYIKLTVETKPIDETSIPEPSLILGIASASAVTLLSRKKEK